MKCCSYPLPCWEYEAVMTTLMLSMYRAITVQLMWGAALLKRFYREFLPRVKSWVHHSGMVIFDHVQYSRLILTLRVHSPVAVWNQMIGTFCFAALWWISSRLCVSQFWHSIHPLYASRLKVPLISWASLWQGWQLDTNVSSLFGQHFWEQCFWQ